MITLQIPIAKRLRNEEEAGSLSAEETAYIMNMRLTPGLAEKRNGSNGVYDFDGEIIGGKRISADEFLLAVADGDSGADPTKGHIYSWNMNASDPEFTALTYGVSDLEIETGYDEDSGTYARFNFENHYDTNLGAQSTIFSNGEETPFFYPQGTGLVYDLTTDELTALYPASMNDALYWGGIIDYVGTAYPYRVLYSDIQDATTYTGDANYNYKDIFEGGRIVTGIKKVGQVLIIAKEDRLWQVNGGYQNFLPLTDNIGCSSHLSMVVIGDVLYLCDNGKIMAVIADSSSQHLSQPVHTLFASSAPGKWDLVTGVAEPYYRNVTWATGRTVMGYSLQYGSWFYDRYANNVMLLDTLKPGEKQAQSWAPPISKHTTMSVAKEDIIADQVFSMSKKLYLMNHFSEDRAYGLASTDDGKPIQAIYQIGPFRLSDSDNYGILRGLMISGKSDGPVTVQGAFSESPNVSEFSTLGTFEFNSTNGAQFDIDSGRAKWATIRLFQNSIYPVKYFGFGALIQPVGRR